jgi:hypothetical protein
VAYTQQKCISYSLGLRVGKAIIKAPEDSVSGEELLSGSWIEIFSLCPYIVEGTRVACSWALIPSPKHFPRPPLFTIILGIRIST